MDGTLTRTSVTVDEAVAILLGWVTGPIVFTSSGQNLSGEEQEVLDDATFALADVLENLKDSAESALEEAKTDGQPAKAIAKMREAIERQKEVARMANTYLCAVADEINKGGQSGLRVDTVLSNSVCTYVTLTSLDEWAKARYGKSVLQQIHPPVLAVAVHNKASPKPRTKLRDQEQAVLLKIESLGYSSKSLPRNEPGKPGVKARVKAALATDPSFSGKTSFDKTWDRLRQWKSIVDSA